MFLSTNSEVVSTKTKTGCPIQNNNYTYKDSLQQAGLGDWIKYE